MKKVKLELKDKAIKPLKRERSLVISPKKIVLVVSILFLVLVGLYFWREIGFLIKAPSLEVTQPPTDITLTQDNFEIIGNTDPVVYLTVNNEEVYIDKKGNFRTEIELSEGLNIIKIKAKNRFGRTNEIIRRIIYEKR
jgi:hypothetical protein